MVSAVFFAWNNLTQVFKPANKIEVLDFVFPGGQTYANRGANDVFVSHADIIWGNGQYARVPIEHIVQHGTVYYREETEKEKKFHNADLPYVWDERGDGSRFLKNARITPDPKTCYGIEIYSQDNSRITQANKYFTDRKVATTYARATLTYYTLSGNSILDNDNMTFNIDFPAELALRDLQNVRCATSR